MNTEAEGENSTLGTDPWGDGTAIVDGTVWVERREELQRLMEAFETALDGLGKPDSEAARLREVVRRLEERVFDLEAQLRDRTERMETADHRLQTLIQELLSWKKNAPSLST